MRKLVSIRSALIALLLSGITWAAPCWAATKVIFVNGGGGQDVSSVEERAKLIRDELGEYLSASGIELGNFPVVEGLFESVASIKCQKDLIRLAAADFSAPLPSDKRSDFLINLGRLYNQLDIAAYFPDCARAAIIAKGLAGKILYEQAKGNKIVILAHSQGNFFAEAAIGILLDKGKINSVDDLPLVSLGSIAPSTRAGFVLNISIDTALFGYDAGYLGFGFNWAWTPAIKHIACAASCPTAASHDEIVAAGGDPRAHALRTYVSKFIRVTSDGKTTATWTLDAIKRASGTAADIVIEWKPSVAELPWRDDGTAIGGWWTYSHLPYYGYVQLVRIKLPSPQRIGDLKIGFKVRNSGPNCDVHMLVGNEQPIPGDSTNMYPYYSWYNCMMTPGPIEREVDLAVFPTEIMGSLSCPSLYHAYCNQNAMVSYVVFHFRDSKDLDYIRVKSGGVTILDKDF